MSDWRAAVADDERLTAILAYSELLTLAPASVQRADVDRMRSAGLDDEAILHVCEVTSYYAYANRIADGLAVQLEEGWSEPVIQMPDRGAPRDLE